MAEIKTVGVIGAGQMGTGIAHVCALAGYEVLLNDISAEKVEASLRLMRGNMARQVAKGIIAVRDKAEKEFGVDSIPTFFINGELLKGETSIEEFRKKIDPLL